MDGQYLVEGIQPVEWCWWHSGDGVRHGGGAASAPHLLRLHSGFAFFFTAARYVLPPPHFFSMPPVPFFFFAPIFIREHGTPCSFPTSVLAGAMFCLCGCALNSVLLTTPFGKWLFENVSVRLTICHSGFDGVVGVMWCHSGVGESVDVVMNSGGERAA